jgi:hypothetical protein
MSYEVILSLPRKKTGETQMDENKSKDSLCGTGYGKGLDWGQMAVPGFVTSSFIYFLTGSCTC